MPRPPRQIETPTKAAGALERVLARVDPHRVLAVYRVWTFWDEVVGAQIAARARPGSFYAGVLSIRVRGHGWMQELQFLKEDLRARLNERLGAELIRDLYFVSEAGPAAEKAERKKEPEPVKPERDPVPIPPLGNPELTAVFERISRAHARRGRREK